MRRVLVSLQVVALGVVVRRLLPGARSAKAVRGITAHDSAKVSVIIPARNEALRIANCLEGLQSLDVDEVVVVDDQSTDATAEIAESFGALVINGSSLPEGWVGKQWALQQGLHAARNDIVVLLDADTVPKPGLIGALVESLKYADVVSFAPRFLTSSLLEQALHASMLTGLVYRFGAVGVEVSDVDRIYGNGQCLAFRRSWLQAQGGMGLVAREMNDDIALLRALASRGARLDFQDGREVLDVRMYSSTSELWQQWPRSLPMVDISGTASRLFDLCLLWLVLVAPWVHVLSRRSTLVDRLCLTLRGLMCIAVSPSYAGSKVGVFASPLCDAPAVARLTQVMVRPVRQWRGRAYKTRESATR